MAPGRPWPDPGPTLVAPGRAGPGPRASWFGPALEGQGQGPVKVGRPWPDPARGQCNDQAATEEVQAAIEEINEDNTDQQGYLQVVYSAGPQPQTQVPEVEIELYDSGASRHMSPFIHRFTNYRSIPPRPITAANKRTFYAIGTGDLQIDVPNGQGTTPVTLRDTLHAPEMALTIVSIG